VRFSASVGNGAASRAHSCSRSSSGCCWAGALASFRPPGAAPGLSYLAYLYPGILVLVLLFTAIFATISTVEDRQSGFLQGVLAAPLARSGIVLGQALGGTTLAVGQGAILLLLAPLAGLSLSLPGLLASVLVLALVGFGLTSLGLVIAWRLESTQGFHAIMNLILIPIWLMSGAFFPSEAWRHRSPGSCGSIR